MLGDAVESALAVVGISKEQVEWWVGGPCGCKQRQEKLNAIGRWAARVLSGKTDGMLRHLKSLVGEDT